jgi:methylated-DNA-protein-cysteine methyltransferase-like protein
MVKPIRHSEKNKDFFDLVYQVVKQIPEGRVTSYGAIANFLSTGKAARMVGWAMNACNNRTDVPAHRVVNRNGVLTGKMHFATPTRMQEELEREGHRIENDQIIRFKEVFWDPQKEIAL